MFRYLAAASLAALVILPTHGWADEASCTKTLGKEIGKYMKSRLKAISKCEDNRSKDSLPATTVCRPQCDDTSSNVGEPCRADGDCDGGLCITTLEAATDAKLVMAESKSSDKISGKCDDLSLPRIGPACDDQAATVAELTDCITGAIQDTNVATINVDTLAATIYNTNAPVTDAGLQKCQSRISKATGKYLSSRYKALQKCHEKLAGGKIAGPCPDDNTAAAIEKARVKMDSDIRKKCTETQLAADTPPKLDFGAPCEAYKFTTFERDGVTNNNVIPVIDRLIPCLTDSAAAMADRMLAIAYPGFEASAFAQGVMAGDATDTAAIFWTRLPDPGTGADLDVSTDPTFQSGVQTISIATPDAGNDGTVKEEVSSLTPFTTYYYRFRQGSNTSPTGRVRTAPAPGDTQTVRFGWSGDANAFFRPFTVLDPIRLLDPDAWFFIGDTIYGDDPRSAGLVATTVDDYYFKYRENLEDAPLRNLNASTGTYVMWDDHEVRNDFAGAVPAFAARMADGNHAFRRYFPIRDDAVETTRLYRSFKWGTLAEFFLIDYRQYRSAKYTCCNDPAEDGFVLVDDDTTCTVSGDAALPSEACSAALATPGRTVLGAAQKAWLENGLLNSTATFKFIMNGPAITNLVFQPYDFWIGYPEERDEILAYILDPNGDLDQSDRINNVIWLSTDLHGILISAERVSVGPSQPVPEVVGGAIGMDPIFRELPASVAVLLPALPALLTQITQYDIDRFNAALLTVAPGAPATAGVEFYDRSGAVIQAITFEATP